MIEDINMLLAKADSQFKQWKRPSNQTIEALIAMLHRVKSEMEEQGE